VTDKERSLTTWTACKAAHAAGQVAQLLQQQPVNTLWPTSLPQSCTHVWGCHRKRQLPLIGQPNPGPVVTATSKSDSVCIAASDSQRKRAQQIKR